MNSIQDVIKLLEACRDTHVEAVEYYDNGHTPENWVEESGSLEEALGTRLFHDQCVQEYQEAIDYLRSI